MKKIQKLLALLLVVVMTVSMAACGNKKDKNNETTTEAATSQTEVATEITVNLHYLREDGNYDGWNVWMWTVGDGAAYQFGQETDENGVVTTATFPAGTTSIGYIVRLNEWDAKDVDMDQFIDTTAFIAGTIDVYVKSGVEGHTIKLGDDCVTGLGITGADMKGDYKTVQISFTQNWTDEDTVAILDKSGKEVEIAEINVSKNDARHVEVVLKEEVDKFSEYNVKVNGTFTFGITIPDYFSTDAFEEEFTYDGDDLGAVWSADSTTFKVWAPTAESVSVNLYETGNKSDNNLIKTEEMTKGDKGVWSVTIDGDLNKTYYTYTVNVGGAKNEACDPYAKAVGVNGERAMVINLASTDPEGWGNDKNPNSGMEYTDASVWEVHIRDFSIDESSGMKNPGKYLAFTELGTTNATGQSTGIDYLKELGITHVQIGPSYDYATVDETKPDTPQYNWGYDPKNYNVPEGSYSTDPYNGEVRVNEYKQMVQSLHENGFSVVMDVVYNHTYNTSYCFNKIVPEYFYRPGSNGSGCGNDVASERAMVRKFIVDSVVYWATEYHIDGFRFDLVGLIDTETIKAVRAALDEIDPSIILYGEGWTMSTLTTKSDAVMATQSQTNKLGGFAMFNDTIRDAIKGSVFNATEKGYVNGNFSKASVIKTALTGKVSWSTKGEQQIIYASCHDNMTLWDEISSSNPDDSLEDRIKQNLLSAAIVYTSQGVPFILAGEEILRTKENVDGSFNHNSYNAPDSVNSIKWYTLNDPVHNTVLDYYKGLIAFRKAHASLTMTGDATKYYTFSEGLDEGVIAYELKGVEEEQAEAIFAVYNPRSEAVTVTLPEGNWNIYVQGDKAGTTSLGVVSGTVTVDAISCTVLVKEK